jgi:hypothetical protein
MGIIGKKKESIIHNIALNIRNATHLLCTKTGYMDNDVDNYGNPTPYAIAGRIYKIDSFKNPERKDGELNIVSECCIHHGYNTHTFPSDHESLRELGFLPIIKKDYAKKEGV